MSQISMDDAGKMLYNPRAGPIWSTGSQPLRLKHVPLKHDVFSITVEWEYTLPSLETEVV